MSEPQAPSQASDGEPSVDPLLGRTFEGRFRVVAPIGHGGMGRVYKAIQLPLDRTVALKVLHPTFAEAKDDSFVKRFFLEASVTSKLTHPNTITIFDYGRTEDGIFFIAMEYLEGQTLSRLLHSQGAVTAARVVRIATQIARSLREAHAAGIIHRDLKPANVMVLSTGDEDDRVKVLDFGLVKFFGDRELELTNAGTFMGSPHYIAPEQAKNDNPDPRADVYSLGILMYHMATGRVPYTAPTSIAVVLAHLNETARPPRQVNPKIPEALEAVILKAMEKDREKRFASMDALLEALRRVATQLGLATTTTTNAVLPVGLQDAEIVEELEPIRARRPLIFGGAVVLGIAAAAGLWFGVLRPAPAPIEPPPVERPSPVPAEVPPVVVAPATGLVFVTSEPPGAELWEGPARVGLTPFAIERPIGSSLSLVVKVKGHQDEALTHLVGGGRAELHVPLRKLVKAPPGGKGPPPGGYKEDPY